jgi:antitoxin MazE
MKLKVQKWGNSLALRIPKTFADEVDVKSGSVVNLFLDEGKLVITPIKSNKFTLDELISQIDENNIHNEVSTGEALGKEIW